MRRYLLFILFSLAMLAIVLYQVEANIRARAIGNAERALAARAALVADALDRTLQQRMVQVFTFAALPSFRGFAASDEAARPSRAAVARTELEAIVTADPNVRAAAIVDRDGQVVLATDATIGDDWSERLFVREALAGQLHASVPARGFRETSQYYSAPILNNAGDVAAALVVRVAAQEMWSIFASQPDVLLVDDIGMRIGDRSAAPLVFVALAPVPPDVSALALAEKRYGEEISYIGATSLTQLKDALARASPARVVYRDAKGQTVHAETARLAANPWTIIAFESEDAMLVSEQSALADAIVVASIFGMVVAGFFLIPRKPSRGGTTDASLRGDS